MATASVHFSNKSDCWETPQELFDRLDDEFEFTTDACAEPHNAKCGHYTPAVDGLAQAWAGVCWCNPAYSDSSSWIRKAFESSRNGTIVACLIPARDGAAQIRRRKGECAVPVGRRHLRPTPRMRPIVRSWDWRRAVA